MFPTEHDVSLSIMDETNNQQPPRRKRRRRDKEDGEGLLLRLDPSMPGEGDEDASSMVPVLDPYNASVYEVIGMPEKEHRTCWACNDGLATDVPINTNALDRMQEMLERNFRTMDHVVLAGKLHRHFMTHVWEPANRNLRPGETPIPEWRKADMWYHMTVVAPTLTLKWMQMERDSYQIHTHLVRFQLYERDAMGPDDQAPRVNQNVLKMVHEEGRRWQQLARFDPKKLPVAHTPAARSWNTHRPAFRGGLMERL